MNPKGPGTSPQPTTTNLVCPRCGGPVLADIAFGSNFCGVRTVASCKNGCEWTPQEQQKMNLQASDEVFS